MPPKPCNSPNAERLKTQGNEFYQKGQYQAAHQKYTEAIKEDASNAIYYGNRAASCLAMKEYLDAAADAQKATDLDPKYAKGWSRLASAEYELSSYSKSVDAWTTALKCLPPKEQSNDTDKNMRSQFEAGLARAQKAREAPSQVKHIVVPQGQKLPWTMAMAIEPELIAAEKISSGFVILHAYREFKKGVDAMKTLRHSIVNGKTKIEGHAGALANITNGVMRDPRAFHFDCTDWIEKFNQQVSFEAEVHKAWVHGGAKTIKQEAPQLLKKEGWHRVRPALATTVRAWLMCGFLSTSTNKHSTAMEYYSRITDVLEWGARIWANVDVVERGVVFEKTFIRGVNRMKLSAMYTCMAAKVQIPSLTRENMVNLALEVITETESNPPDPNVELDAGFLASFWMYPKAEALSILGWHYMQLGLRATDSEEAQAAFTQSADYYIQAAKNYPVDDENTILFRKVALEAYWYLPKGKTLMDMMPVIMEIDLALQGVMKIWANAASNEERDGQIMQALSFIQRCDKAVQDGKITMQDLVRPKEVEKTCKWKGNFVYI